MKPFLGVLFQVVTYWLIDSVEVITVEEIICVTVNYENEMTKMGKIEWGDWRKDDSSRNEENISKNLKLNWSEKMFSVENWGCFAGTKWKALV